MDNTVGRLNDKLTSKLTNQQKSLIIGSILGDGYIRQLDGRSDAFLEINHSLKAKDYVDHKYKILKNICESAPKERYTDEEKTKKAYRFYTRQHKEITDLYNEFYKNKKKIISRNLKLDPVILAIWYMDDGSKTQNKENAANINIYLNTQQFSLSDQKYLLYLLREIGVNARLNKDKNYYRIRILKESIKTFMDIIDKNIIDSMRYKMYL